jgi:hypothetical protein
MDIDFCRVLWSLNYVYVFLVFLFSLFDASLFFSFLLQKISRKDKKITIKPNPYIVFPNRR